MLIAGVLCVSAAVVMAVLGLRSLVRPVGTGTVGLIMRSVAPPQLAGAIMLAAGGTVALAAPAADRTAGDLRVHRRRPRYRRRRLVSDRALRTAPRRGRGHLQRVLCGLHAGLPLTGTPLC